MIEFRSLPKLALFLVLILSSGCFPASPEAGADQIFFDFEYDLKGFCLYWFRDVAIENPRAINVFMPHLTGFSWPVGNIGTFGINLDQEGPDEATFGIVSNGSFAFVDLDSNDSLSGDDIRIDWNPSEQRFEVNDHPFGGQGIAAGFYYMRFNPGVLFPESGDDSNSCWDVSVELITGVDVIRRNRSLCRNVCLLTHLGFGEGLSTEIVVYNPNPVTVSASLNFYAPDGQPGLLEIDEVRNTFFQVTLPPFGSKRLRPSGTQEGIQVLWGYGSATLPISCGLDFATRNGASANGLALENPQQQEPAELLGEAGIAAATLATRHVLNVVKKDNVTAGLAIKTALAVANPTSSEAHIRVLLKDSLQVEVGQTQFSLFPKNQRAIFISDLFEDLDSSNFDGTAVIESDTDIAVMSLQTDGSGYQQASLPSASRVVPQ